MSNLTLVELVDDNFNPFPHFIGLEKFYEKQIKPKINIFGFNNEFSNFSENLLYPLFLPKTFEWFQLENPFLARYNKLIFQDIFRNLNNHFEVSIRDENNLNNELERLKYESKNYDENNFPNELQSLSENTAYLHKKENILLKYKLSYAIFLNNVLSSRVKYFYSEEISELINQSKKANSKDFSKKKLNEYLLDLYRESILLKEDYVVSDK